MIFMTEKKSDEETDDEVDDELDRAFAMQDMIHHKCKIRDDPKKKQEEWEKKYG